MTNIYDNGALMLGNVQLVIMEVEKEMKENIDMAFTDQQELLKELKELRNIDYDMIVCINYENPMGYTIDYWTSNDIIKKEVKK